MPNTDGPIPVYASRLAHQPKRNSPDRRTMLLKRRALQEQREFGVWENTPGHAPRFYSRMRPTLLPAWMNRWTGKPHEHRRAKARRLRQAA